MPSVPLLAGALAAALALVPAAHAQYEMAGRGLTFDGVDDLAIVPYHPDLDVIEAFTLEAWVSTSDPNGGIVGIWGAGGSSDKFMLSVEAGHFRGRMSRGIALVGHEVLDGPHVPAGLWTHVALSYDGHEFKLHVFGSTVASSVFDDEVNDAVGRDLTIGATPSLGMDEDEHLMGRIDEVRLWNRALTDEEMARQWNALVPPDAEGLVAVWHMDDAPHEQVLVDATGHGHHGHLGHDAFPGPDDAGRGPSLAPLRWADAGFGLAGTHGVPRLSMKGVLLEGSFNVLYVDDMLEDTEAAFVLGHGANPTAFKGGTMLPTLDVVVPGLPTGPLGSQVLDTLWPAMPPGADVFVQFWIVDGAAPFGYAASNALWLEAP